MSEFKDFLKKELNEKELTKDDFSKHGKQIKDEFYALSNSLGVFVDTLEAISKDNKKFNREYKLYKRMYDLWKKSTLGAFV